MLNRLKSELDSQFRTEKETADVSGTETGKNLMNIKKLKLKHKLLMMYLKEK